MGKKYDFVNRVDIDSELEKKCSEIEKEISVLEGKKAEMLKKVEALKPALWQTYQDFQRACICGDGDAGDRFTAYRKILADKNSVENNLPQKIENRKSESNALISPLKHQIIELIQREIQKLGELYVCETPVSRVNASGREVSILRQEIESNQSYLDVVSNGWALQLMKKHLIVTLGAVAQAWSLTELRRILEGLSKSLNSVDTTPEKSAIRIEDFERLNKPQSFEWGYFSEGGVEKINPNATAQRSEQRIPSGKNPW